MVTHDPRAATFADRVLFLADGVIVNELGRSSQAEILDALSAVADPMRRVALRGLLARKLRSALTAVAIVLGVAMVSGTLVLTDTIDKAFDSIFSSSYEQTDAVVSGKLVEWSQTGKATISADVLRKVEALPRGRGLPPGRSWTCPATRTRPRSWTRAARRSRARTRPSVSASSRRTNGSTFQARRGDLGLRPRRGRHRPEHGRREGFQVGEQIEIAGEGPVRTFTLTGIVRFGDVDSLGGATIALFDVATARQVLAKSGFDAVAVAARDGVPRKS